MCRQACVAAAAPAARVVRSSQGALPAPDALTDAHLRCVAVGLLVGRPKRGDMATQRLDLLLDRNSKLSAQCDVQRKQINTLEKR